MGFNPSQENTAVLTITRTAQVNQAHSFQPLSGKHGRSDEWVALRDGAGRCRFNPSQENTAVLT